MATVNISLQDILGLAVSCCVKIAPITTPFINGTKLTVSRSLVIWTDTTGFASIVLQPGQYTVQFVGIFGNTDLITIGVPDDSGTYDMVSIIGGGIHLPEIITGSTVYIGTTAKLVPIAGGFKIQTTADNGQTWVDGPSFTAT
jgi:hypothetical protein